MKYALICFVLIFGGVANADYLDLTFEPEPDAGTFGQAIFSTDFLQSVGTGIFEPFWRANVPPGSKIEGDVRAGNSSTESWYEFFNSDARPLDGALEPGNNANGGDITNRTFLIGTLQPVEFNGANYFVFILDTNEPNSEGQEILSLDVFRLYSSASSTLSTFAGLEGSNLIYSLDDNPCAAPLPGDFRGACVSATSTAGTLADGDTNTGSGVLLTEDFQAGSGVANLIVYVPVSLFSGFEDQYLYLDAMFGGVGEDAAAQDGFEEWSALRGEYVPEPASILGLGTVLLLLGSRLRRKRA